ncbi:MAG: glycosyltransferase family 2 protein [Oscillospiraceae bacterium]|nr:glycosyltransferase family 2 protein [Oscillospiraceae bacterium]MBQ9148220.1 glycosyltransferase family 2 protein [Oscillospiraceae bacterium]
MNVYAVLEALSTGLVVLTTICYFYQIIYLVLPLILKDKPHQKQKPNRYAILIAARNEEAVLPHLLDSIAAQTYSKERISTFVVADNCTDDTARVAAAHGATVFQRFNQEKIGKGYALNYLLGKIDETRGLENYDAFLIFDADNLLDKDYVNQMNAVVSDGYPAFCGYRNSKNFGDNWLSAGYGLWYLHDSTHMNRSRMRLGTTCAVSGTGFGFTRQLLEEMGGWNFFTLTEDIEFTTWCAAHGIRVGYCHDAVLYDEQPTSLGVSIRQRTRWVQGGLQVSIRYAGELVRGLFRGPRAAYASFETATLSLWGYGMSILSFGSALMVTYLAERWVGLAQAVALSILGAYVSFFLIGALTMATEHRRIRAGVKGKLLALIGFPLFMLSYAPIALTAVFRKFQWQPIHHTVAVSAEQFHRGT